MTVPPMSAPPRTPRTSAADLPAAVLRSRYRWERWRGVLSALLAGLSATLAVLWALHPAWRPPEHWRKLALVWTVGGLLTAFVAALLRRLAPSSLAATARGLDRGMDARNRLETAALLLDDPSPLARAQRDETAAYLSRGSTAKQPVRALPWLVAGVVVLLLLHVVTLAVWVVPPLLHRIRQAEEKPAAEGLPEASITWKSPEPESKANQVEEVPAVAAAQSTTGLKDLTLEISVNGTPLKSVALPTKPFDQAGNNPVKVSLYMDELGVEPFDVVSYFISARRITDQKVPDTTSPIQFIQVRPFRDDVRQAADMDDRSGKFSKYLVELKLAQLRSVKENFVLATTDLPAANPVLARENERVGKNEAALAAKTEEVVQAFIQGGVEADIIDLLKQAEPLMDDASKKILATQNSQALPLQEKALNLIVQTEKFVQKVMVNPSDSAADRAPPDPFRDKQQHELKKREASAAGKLEQLAEQQSKLANDLSRPETEDDGNSAAPGPPEGSDGSKPEKSGGAPGAQSTPTAPQASDATEPGPEKGAPAERETGVLRGIESLLSTGAGLPPSSTQALRDAQKDAAETLKQLDLSDEAAAREAAMEAARDLRTATQEMNQAGLKDTRQAMEDGQQALNDIDRQLRELAGGGTPDPQKGLDATAQKLEREQRKLQEAADQQQESGSNEGAERLENLANAISNQKVQADLAGMGRTGLEKPRVLEDARKLEDLASQAAQATALGNPNVQEIAELLHSLEASRANLARLAEQAGGSKPAQDSQGIPADAKAGNPGTGKDSEKGSGTKPGDWNDRSAEGYRETVDALVDESQRIAVLVPDADSSGLVRELGALAGDPRNAPARRDMGGYYQALSPPLDKLITQLATLLLQAQRQEVIRQPDLDEAPSAYRPSVADYFESMSRDYHPDGDGEPKKP